MGGNEGMQINEGVGGLDLNERDRWKFNDRDETKE